MAAKLLTHEVSEPLDGATSATFDINTGSGNLRIDKLPVSAPLLASGTLEYLEDQGVPGESLDVRGGQATLTISARGTRQPLLRFPWSACNAATEWRIHLNPVVASNLTACSGGGNVTLDLAGTAIGRVSADTGGGNIDLTLPENVTALNAEARTGGGNITIELGARMHGSSTVNARSGAGNVAVRLPAGFAARIHAGSGMGKVAVEVSFRQVGKSDFESPGYDSAADRVEITVHSGAGNVTVSTR